MNAGEGIVVVRTPWGQFRVAEGDRMVQQLSLPSGHQGLERDLLISLVQRTDTVVDIGAHIGTIAVPLARAASAGRLLAIEAVPSTFELLRQNITLNQLPHVVTVNALVGLGHTPRAVGVTEGNSGSTNFRRPAADGQGVLPRSLSEIVSRNLGPDAAIDVMKIDVEGMEPEVLESGAALFHRKLPIVMLEVYVPSPHRRQGSSRRLRRLDRFFEPFDYRLFAVLGETNGQNPVPEIAEIGSFRSLAPFLGVLIDVIAVPRKSSRLLSPTLGPIKARARLLGMTVKAASGSLRRALTAKQREVAPRPRV